MGIASGEQENYNSDISFSRQISSSSMESQNSPMDLSKTSKRFPFIRSSSINNSNQPHVFENKSQLLNLYTTQISNESSHEAPEILIQPKPEWHYRSAKDLAKNHIPFLSGIGPQRTPIRIKVPSQTNRKMYVCISVMAVDHTPHDSKIIVPAKTKVKVDELSHDNTLSYLDFSECNRTDHFDKASRTVFLEINSTEHLMGIKDVRVYMFNLYQNRMITKEIIETKKLYLCQLAFTFYIYEGNGFISISKTSYSDVIREKRSAKRHKPSFFIDNSMHDIDITGPTFTDSFSDKNPEMMTYDSSEDSSSSYNLNH